MRVTPSLALAALAAVLAAPVQAAPPEKQTLTVTNGASRIVECAVIVDGKARTQLKIRPGKTWADVYDPRRAVQLVCERTKEGVYGPLKIGSAYRFEDGPKRIDLAEAAGE